MKRFNTFLMIAGAIMLCVIASNIIMLLDMKAAIDTGTELVQWMGTAVAGGIIITGLIHGLGLIGIFTQYKRLKQENMAGAAAFVTGLVSFFLLIVDATMLQDIGNEYMAGWNGAGEWGIVFIGHGFHALFGAAMILQCILAGKNMRKGTPDFIAKDEVLFLTVHQIGIFSAVIGLVFIAVLYCFGTPRTAYSNGLLFLLSIVVLLPYAAAVLYWLFTKRRVKIKEWYDEKQFIDILRGALVALIVSVLAIMVMFLLSILGLIKPGTVIWFPVYLFVTLLVFSGSALYLSKRGLGGM
jgi:predicted membrane channel-forming protein YqfA (hemolysin III family)